eukprot:gene12617-14809_t
MSSTTSSRLNVNRRKSFSEHLATSASNSRRLSFDTFPKMETFFETPINNMNPIKFDILKNNLFRAKSVVEIEAERTFNAVWGQMTSKYGLDYFKFPNDITWLLGGPGAGKGTNTSLLSKTLGIDSNPIVMSSLLNSPECIAIKKAGGLVNDKVVLELLLKELGKPNFTGLGNKANGVIIDGFPRNEKQVKFVELLYDKLSTIRQQINPNATKPKFRVTVLHVSEEESVQRQLARGLKTVEENEQRKLSNLPTLEVRDTDIDPAACKKRYDIYKSQFDQVQSLSERFQYTEIDANGTLGEVERIIMSTHSM